MNFVSKLRNYFNFSNKELTNMFLISLAAAFMLSFRDWGYGDVFNARVGLFNLFNTFLITSVAILVHESMHKIIAIYKGYVSEHRPWWPSIGVGLLLTFMTQGYLFFFGFGLVIYHLAGERLGTFRYGFNVKDLGFISIAGAAGNLLLVILFKLVFLLNASPLAEKAMLINIWFAAFNILPLPWVDGGNIFFAGRTRYIFFLGLVACASIFLYLSSSIIAAIVISIILAGILAIFWAVFAEGIVEVK